MKLHSQIQSETRTVGKWPFRKRKTFITCNCGWKGRDDVPGAEMQELSMVHQYLVRLEMDTHVINEAIKLGWKPRERKRY